MFFIFLSHLDNKPGKMLAQCSYLLCLQHNYYPEQFLPDLCLLVFRGLAPLLRVIISSAVDNLNLLLEGGPGCSRVEWQ